MHRDRDVVRHTDTAVDLYEDRDKDVEAAIDGKRHRCYGGVNDSPPKCVHILTQPLETSLGTSCGVKVFANVIKDLKMRSSWIIRIRAKSNDKRHHERGGTAKAGVGKRQRWEPRNARSPRESGETSRWSPRALGCNVALLLL